MSSLLWPKAKPKAVLWPKAEPKAMLWSESWRETMLHPTISMNEKVCAPSEILSPSEVLATVGCDASALTPLTASNV